MKKIISGILSITILLSMSLAAPANTIVVCPEETELPQEVKILKVGINAECPPFAYYEEDKLTGFDIDLMYYIGERIGYDIAYVNMPFDALIPAVASGKVDCAISGITITEQREEIIDYTRPYMTANVTYEGEESVEQYGIVFKNGLTDAVFRSASPTDEEMLCFLVNDAVLGLKKDASIVKLIEKHGLNNGINDDKNYQIKYTSVFTLDDLKHQNGIPYATDGLSPTPLAPPSDWAKDSVIKAEDLGIAEKGKAYSYGKPITREEFCELIYNYCGNVLGMLAASDGKRFTDTDNPKIEVLCAMGIINGKSETEFAPDDYLTREEAAVILRRMVNATVPVEVTEIWFEFDDLPRVSGWAMDAVQTMCNMNVMNGVGENKFAPQDRYTAEQAIATIVRVYAVQFANTGRIGGADAPTEIYVGGDVGFVLEVIDKDGHVILNDNDILSCDAMNGKITEHGGLEWHVVIQFSEEGRKKFKEATKKISEYPAGENYLAVLIDGQVITQPTVMEEIDSEGVFITGDFTEESAKALEAAINSGIDK